MKEKQNNEEQGLTQERILKATVEVLQRYGPAKTTVTDIAQAMGVTHGSIYRYFPSKKALLDAVVEQWLHRISGPLKEIADSDDPADVRLRKWVLALVRAKRQKVLHDPELFHTYHQIAGEAHEVIDTHVEELIAQLAQILKDGQKSGLFHLNDATQSAAAIFTATSFYHHPYHVLQQKNQDTEKPAGQLTDLLIRGLKK